MTLIAIGALDNALSEVPSGNVGALLQRNHQIMQVTLGQHEDGGESDDGMELGLCFFRPEIDVMTFVGARFELYEINKGELLVTRGAKSGIGYRGIPYTQEYEEHVIADLSNKAFYMTSDGLIDQVGGDRRRMFGKRRFRELLLRINEKPMADQKEAFYQALIDYQGKEKRRDDISLMGFRV
jgi:hypothetical protein